MLGIYHAEMENNSVSCGDDEDSDAKAIRTIFNILTQDKYSEKCRLSVLRGLKLMFAECKPSLESVLLRTVDVETLFDAIKSIDMRRKCVKEFTEDYGNFLLRLVQTKQPFLKKIRAEFKLFAKQLTVDTANSELVKNIWSTFEINSLVWPDVIIHITPFSKTIIEEVVYKWLNNLNEVCEFNKVTSIVYYTDLSVECVELFQIISSVLNQFVLITGGNTKILQFVEYYVSSVTDKCHDIGKSIFNHYPRKYLQLISLLQIPPEAFSNKKNEKPSVNYVLDLLIKNFKEDKDMVQLLLTHSPKWLNQFSRYLKENNDHILDN